MDVSAESQPAAGWQKWQCFSMQAAAWLNTSHFPLRMQSLWVFSIFVCLHMLSCLMSGFWLSAGKLMLVADFGRFVLKSDTGLAATLPVEEASVYECLTLKGRDISAYVVDGDFTFAALEEQAAKQQAADPAEGSAVSEAIGQVRW